LSPWVPRVLLGVLAVGVGYAIIAIAVGEGGPQAVEIEGRPEVQKLIAGIRQEEERLGSPDAPVEIDLFTDVRSVPGADFQREVVDPLINEYVRTDRALINLHHFSFGRTAVTEAAIAADAAGAQGHQWQFADLLLRNLGLVDEDGVDEEFLNEIAEVTPGLEHDEWEVEFEDELELQRDDPDYESAVDADGRLAFELKLPAQPVMIVTGPGGEETLDEVPTLDEARLAIERVEVPQG
jgi:protein-disulfide isomerase